MICPIHAGWTLSPLFEDDGYQSGEYCSKCELEKIGKNKGPNTMEEKLREAIDNMKTLKTMRDTEVAHGDADEILCDFLIGQGFELLVDEYKKIDKWYA